MFPTPISTAVTVLLLAGITSAQIPPAFSPSSSVQLLESFQSNTVLITPGQTLSISTPASAPALGLTNTNSTTTPYVLIMIDPDAPSPSSPTSAQILHWLQPNLTVQSTTPFPHTLTNLSAAFVPYARPSPPNYSPVHRYIQYLFAQPSTFQIPADFMGYSAKNRTKFDIARFVAEAGLGAPIAANYFLVANQTGSATTNGTAGGNATGTGRPATFTGVAASSLTCSLSAAAVVLVGLGAAFAV